MTAVCPLGHLAVGGGGSAKLKSPSDVETFIPLAVSLPVVSGDGWTVVAAPIPPASAGTQQEIVMVSVICAH